MPYQTTQTNPEVVLEYKDRVVYRTYVDDDMDDPERWIFSTDIRVTDSADVRAFNVTRLKVPSAKKLKTGQPQPAKKERGMTHEIFINSPGYLKAESEWNEWWEVQQPALILEALKEAIDQDLI